MLPRWLNQIEIIFGVLTRRVAELDAAIAELSIDDQKENVWRDSCAGNRAAARPTKKCFGSIGKRKE